MMRAGFRLLVLAVMSISLLALFLPISGAIAIPQSKADYCTKAADDGCCNHPPKPKQERDCCVACALALTLALVSGQPFFYPPCKDNRFADYLVSEHSRSDRPPVPPPRSLLG